VLAAAAAIVALFLLFDVNSRLRGLLEAIEGLGPAGPVVLIAVYVVATVLFVPGLILTVGAGFVYGVLEGYLYVAVGSVVGGTAAFLIGRTIARARVESRLEGNPRFRAIDRAVSDRGWKIVLLTRLSPVFPFNLQNYMYGVTGISLGHYVLASWIGMIPGTLLYVYLGSAADNLSQIASGELEGGGARTAFFVAGLVATVVVTLYVTRLARHALRSSLPPDAPPAEETAS